VSRSDGSALAGATVASAVLSIMIAGFLSYMSNEYKLNVRSHVWNQGLHLAEAAVEIGFAELNNQYFKGSNGFQSARGWLDQGGGSYSKTVNNFTDTRGNVLGDLIVNVSGVGSSAPKIFGVGITSGNTTQTLSRALAVVVLPSSRYPVGLMSRDRLDLNGNNIYTDSFDSTDPTKSTAGQYDSIKKQSNGDVASNDVLINSVNIGNAEVYGRVSTGRGGTVAMGPNGSVGPTFVQSDRATTVIDGENKGWIRHDFDVDVPDATLPAGATSWPSLGSINSTTTINDGDWRVSGINLTSTRVLTIQGNVRMYVTGNVSIGGSASIVISTNPPNSRLEIYVAGSVSVAGNGVVNNTNIASNNQWFGLPSSTSWTVGGNGQWVGTMYAPQASLRVNGGGVTGDMSGAIVAYRIDLDGTVRFHYDESLSFTDSGAGYLVGSWQALKNENGTWLPE
jgi:hypothetical protein